MSPYYSAPDADPETAEMVARANAREDRERREEQERRAAEKAEFEQLMAKARETTRREEEQRWRREREEEAVREQDRLARGKRSQRFAEQRQAVAALEVPFLETSVFTLINAAVERVVALGRCGLIIGSPGVGKSRALREIVQRGSEGRGREAALIEMSGISGNSTAAVLEEVCAHVGVEPAGSNAETERRLKKQVDFAPVLLFDEAQNLTLTPLRVLLGLAEEIGIPMLFCGNSEVVKRVSSKQAAMRQVSRRLPIREDIDCIADSDAEMIADHFGVVDEEARRLCRAIGEMFYADGVASILTQARLDLPAGMSIGAEHIRAATAWMPQFRPAIAKAAHAPLVRRHTGTAPLKPLRG